MPDPAMTHPARLLEPLETPWLEPFLPWARALSWPVEQSIDLDRACELATARDCRSGSGHVLRFVDAHRLAGGGPGYERRIFDSGQVVTRTQGAGASHDFANALAWLAFPRLKARLNALHVEAEREAGREAGPGAQAPGRRGRLRDRATLFDESGALVLTQDRMLAASMRSFAWHELFVGHRTAWPARIRVVIAGHALLEKLRAPYKSLCAQGWVLEASPSLSQDELDHLAARSLTAESLASLTPVPLMGIPGWSDANQDPAFYNDPQVFRSGRRQ